MTYNRNLLSPTHPPRTCRKSCKGGNYCKRLFVSRIGNYSTFTSYSIYNSFVAIDLRTWCGEDRNQGLQNEHLCSFSALRAPRGAGAALAWQQRSVERVGSTGAHSPPEEHLAQVRSGFWQSKGPASAHTCCAGIHPIFTSVPGTQGLLWAHLCFLFAGVYGSAGDKPKRTTGWLWSTASWGRKHPSRLASSLWLKLKSLLDSSMSGKPLHISCQHLVFSWNEDLELITYTLRET